MDLSKLTVTPVARVDEPRFRALMDEHHYLGAPWKIGQTVCYAAEDGSGEWPALAAFSTAALKCGARDAWIGWSRREQFGRLHLIASRAFACASSPSRRGRGRCRRRSCPSSCCAAGAGGLRAT
ncbi:MAG: DUF4338 domain-containing protein [Boseongicola sp. SB0667_bin_21]|nr:DUF4338 domain-containing protein [Boseongicola sp.]MXW87786.1 DUF4338 domain-containing protein [Boseongicola sp. SB0667_bin_21]